MLFTERKLTLLKWQIERITSKKGIPKQHHVIFVTQIIPLAPSRWEDTFPPALSAKHTPTHPTETSIGVLLLSKPKPQNFTRDFP